MIDKAEIKSRIIKYLDKSQAEILQIPYEIKNNIDPKDVDALLDFESFMVAYKIVVDSVMDQITDCINNYPNGIINAEKYFKYNKEKI